MLPLAFGFGSPADIAIILVVALIIFGPKKLPEVGKQIGQALRELRKVTEELTGTMHSVQGEVESVYKPVLSPPSDYSGNPFQTTSSATVEKAISYTPYDQAPEDLMAAKDPGAKDLMAPAVLPAPHSTPAETPDSTDAKGH